MAPRKSAWSLYNRFKSWNRTHHAYLKHKFILKNESKLKRTDLCFSFPFFRKLLRIFKTQLDRNASQQLIIHSREQLTQKATLTQPVNKFTFLLEAENFTAAFTEKKNKNPFAVAH
jgi:hypothetical protein